MMRWVKVEDVGDTSFLLEEQVDSSDSARKTIRSSRTAAALQRAVRLLLGITKASLSTDSFISAASFQEDHARPHGSRGRRQGRLSSRPQGKRHHGRLIPPGRASSITAAFSC